MICRKDRQPEKLYTDKGLNLQTDHFKSFWKIKTFCFSPRTMTQKRLLLNDLIKRLKGRCGNILQPGIQYSISMFCRNYGIHTIIRDIVVSEWIQAIIRLDIQQDLCRQVLKLQSKTKTFWIVFFVILVVTCRSHSLGVSVKNVILTILRCFSDDCVIIKTYNTSYWYKKYVCVYAYVTAP